jgi:hypothetical protein
VSSESSTVIIYKDAWLYEYNMAYFKTIYKVVELELQIQTVNACIDKINWSRLSFNPNLTFEFVLAYPNKAWNWKVLSRRFAFGNVLTYPDKPWDWYELGCNRSITFDDVLKYHDKPWGWYALSSNPRITFENVLKFPDKPWNWYAMSNKNHGIGTY